MKQFFFAACILIFFSTALALYLRWDNTRFVESLPQAYPTDTDLSPQQEPTDEDKNIDVLGEATTQQDPAHVDKEMPLDTTHRPLHHGETHSLPQTVTRHESKRNIEDIEGLKEESEPFRFMQDLSAEELMASDRQSFLKKHGNIPEIDIYFKYMAPVYEAWASGDDQVVTERTPEETLELSRAQMVLFPDKPHFRNQYQHALKTIEDLKRRRER